MDKALGVISQGAELDSSSLALGELSLWDLTVLSFRERQVAILASTLRCPKHLSPNVKARDACRHGLTPPGSRVLNS